MIQAEVPSKSRVNTDPKVVNVDVLEATRQRETVQFLSRTGV